MDPNQLEHPGKPIKVLLGVSGSVAAYRAADIARELVRLGVQLRVCLTDGAKQFVSPLLFESLTGDPILDSVFDEPVRGRMAHIDWARWADLILIAPATANTVAKMAYGLADDMLSAICVASTATKMVAPAMNPTMYGSESNQEALRTLRRHGTWIVEPDEGDVACGEHGHGKLASIDAIVEGIMEWMLTRSLLKGKKVLITSGPTVEPIDAVRYVSNRSSGKMGAAVARAAKEMGAKVWVVSGPVAEYPAADVVEKVETALEMHEAALRLAKKADLVIGIAAVADYRMESPFPGKMRRSAEPLTLNLVPNPDIIAEVKKQVGSKAVVIGFAAEPNDELESAESKLNRKGLDGLAMNNVSTPGLGFGSDENALTLLLKGRDPIHSGRLTKLECARWLLQNIELAF